MNFLSMLIMSVGLAMDATAVAATQGFTARVIRWHDALRVGLLFGLFQALMPVAGQLAGTRLGPLIARWDHIVAFVLLALIGGKMVWEGFSHEKESTEQTQSASTPPAPFALRGLLVLAVATSIDALAVGVTLPLVKAPLVPVVVTIGVTTAVLSFAGVYIGHRFGSHLGKRLDLLGGIVLIGLGLKMLLVH